LVISASAVSAVDILENVRRPSQGFNPAHQPLGVELHVGDRGLARARENHHQADQRSVRLAKYASFARRSALKIRTHARTHGLAWR